MVKNVVGLHGRIPNPSKAVSGVVSLLEQQLARARAGEITSVCIVYIEVDSVTQENVHRTSWDGSRFTLLGALARAMFAINQSWEPK
jgi:hypothetical protein